MRFHHPARTALLILAVAGTLGACGGGDHDADVNPADRSGGRSDPSVTARDTALRLGPGDVLITNRDSSLDLLLVGDHVATRFSARTMAKIRAETDTSKVDGSGFSASIEKMVKSTVGSALSKEVRYPLADLQEARYEDGRIVLVQNDGKHTNLFEKARMNGKRVDESFAPDDARRFVDAVNARLRSGAS